MKYKNILYLYNPYSNQGKAKKNWEKIVATHPFIKKNAYDFSQIGDISSFLKQKNPSLIVIAAGDGTITKVAGAVLPLKQKPTLAVIPLGFGNAMAYCFGVDTIEKALQTIQHVSPSVTIDVMRTNLPDFPIGLFNISAGFDARIVHDRNKNQYIGLPSYIFAALHSVVKHPHRDITFTIDHAVTLNATVSSLMVANGPILGQNYLVASAAKLNDGFLDCTVFSTKYAYIRNLRLRGFRHPLYSRVGKVHFKASHIRIEGEPFVQVDGDPVLQRKGVEIEILKKKITFLYNKHIDKTSPTIAFNLSS